MQQTDLGLNLSTKSTRKRVFLAQMAPVMPWGDLAAVGSPYAPESNAGRPLFAVLTISSLPAPYQTCTSLFQTFLMRLIFR